MESPDATNGLETIAAEKSEIQAQENADQKCGTGNILDQESRGVKRPAADDEDASDIPITTGEPTLSKNQLRKLKRRKVFEDKRDERRSTRKAKRHKRQEKRRLEKEAESEAAAAEGREPTPDNAKIVHKPKPTRVPISIIMDCQYEKYMMDKELVSLSSQITRCYSDNRGAQFTTHLYVSSYGGQLQERFDVGLRGQYKNWKGIQFLQEDFVDVAKQASELMAGPQGGKLIDLLGQNAAKGGEAITMSKPDESKRLRKPVPVPEPESEDVDKSIVYLTADSPYTLERLEPNTSYIIGGIIDRNREKGLCYKVARERNVRTAKLPIGEFMVMQSRHVLATNHVIEIMLRYLELGDWGAAFMKVIPTRKGGALKDDAATPDPDQEQQNEEEGADEGEDAEEHESAEIEGENEVQGLQENALGQQQRWSAPPAEQQQQQMDTNGKADGAVAAVSDPQQSEVGMEQKPEQPAAEVEGDNAEEGLEKNALDRQRSWSNPPPESDEAAVVEVPASSTEKSADAPL